MALERTQSALEDEIRAARQQLEPHVRTLRDEYLRTCGKWYGGNEGDDAVAEDPENQRQAWLRSFLAEVGGGVPQCVIEAQGMEWPPERAYVVEAACNQLARQSRMRGFVHRTAVDFGFRSARAYMGLSRVRGRVTPFVQDLDFDEFLSDSTVTDRTKARWHAHRVVEDIDDVIARARGGDETWNVGVLERVRDGLGRDVQRSEKVPSSVQRRELSYWVMWEPGYDVDAGRNAETGHYGTLHYVLDSSMTRALKGVSRAEVDSALVRGSEAWFGPETGPYAFAAGFKIGNLPIELAPLVANAVQSGFLNDVARSVKDAIVNYKNNGVVASDTLAAVFRAAVNGQLISVPQGVQISNLIGQIESGGVTPQMLTAFQLMMESSQRASGGMYSNMGEVETDATATAIRSANIGYASTIGLYTSSYLDFLRQVFSAWAYWFDLSPDIETLVDLPDDVAAQLGQRAVMIRGNEIDERSKPDHHKSLSLSIDAFSLRSKNEMTLAQDVMVATQMAQQIVGLGPMALAFDVDGYQRAVARSRGAKWIEGLFDSSVLRLIAAQMLGQQQEPKAPAATARPQQQIQLGSSRPQPVGNPGSGSRAKEYGV